jgi:hypothetical protein
LWWIFDLCCEFFSVFYSHLFISEWLNETALTLWKWKAFILKRWFSPWWYIIKNNIKIIYKMYFSFWAKMSTLLIGIHF